MHEQGASALFAVTKMILEDRWLSEANIPLALNTRKDREGGSSYVLVRVLSICLKVLAVVLWVLGIVSIVAINAAGAIGGLFESF